jgi:cytochrome P450
LTKQGLSQLRGGSGLPGLGETLAFLKDPDTFVRERTARHGTRFRTQLFGRQTAVLIGADANRFVLTKGMEFLRWREGWPPTFPVLLGESLFLQDGEEHRRKRNLLMPAFQPEAVASYVPIIQACLDRQAQEWERKARFACYDEFQRLTLEVACRLFLGTDDDTDHAALTLLIEQLASGLLALPIRFPGTAFSRAIGARKKLLGFAEQAVTAARSQSATHALGRLATYADETGGTLTTEELKSQALFLIIAGYATTSSMLTYLLFALTEHPEVLQRARAEQRELGSEAPSSEALKAMTYLDSILLEVERRYPPVSFGLRAVAQDFEFEDIAIPRGAQVMFSISATHQDPEAFPEPDRFDPERFSGDATDRRNYKLVGFGGGPRVCPGMTLARTQIKLVASKLLRSYDWRLVPNQDMSVIVMPARRPRQGLLVELSRRSDVRP